MLCHNVPAEVYCTTPSSSFCRDRVCVHCCFLFCLLLCQAGGAIELLAAPLKSQHHLPHHLPKLTLSYPAVPPPPWQMRHVQRVKPTSSRKTLATDRYSGDLKAKSTEKCSQVVWAVGPFWNSHTLSKWSKIVLFATFELTLCGVCNQTFEVYLYQQGA